MKYIKDILIGGLVLLLFSCNNMILTDTNTNKQYFTKYVLFNRYVIYEESLRKINNDTVTIFNTDTKETDLSNRFNDMILVDKNKNNTYLVKYYYGESYELILGRQTYYDNDTIYSFFK